MFCSKCGHQIDNGLDFCVFCGQTALRQESPPQVPNNVAAPAAEAKEQSKSRSLLMVTLILWLASAINGFVVQRIYRSLFRSGVAKAFTIYEAISNIQIVLNLFFSIAIFVVSLLALIFETKKKTKLVALCIIVFVTSCFLLLNGILNLVGV